MRQITSGGIIRGTYEYRGTKELEEAEPANTGKLFSPWPGEGKVLYRLKLFVKFFIIFVIAMMQMIWTNSFRLLVFRLGQ